MDIKTFQHALIIYNPCSGSATDRDLWLGTIVDKLCTKHKWLLSVQATTADTSVVDIIKDFRLSVDLIIAAGGDGTIRSVLGALSKMKLNIPVGIIPFGTGNQLARNLGIYPENPLIDPLQQALEIISNGESRSIDLGEMNGHHFCVGVGAGPLSDAILIPSQQDKANWGMLAYVGSMLQNAIAPSVHFRVTADDDKFDLRASGLFVSNVGNLGLTTISHSAELDDGLLDLCIITLSEFSDYVKLGFQLATVISTTEAPYYIRKAKKITIENTGKAQTANVDGDACGKTPMRINVIPNGARILCPKLS